MSSFIGILLDNIVFIGTDTLASRPYQEPDDELKPLMFVPKVFHLPHLRCALGCTGYYKIGAKFYEFVAEKIVGKDINSIVNVGLSFFNQIIINSEYAHLHGSLYLYGYDDSLNKFKGYRTYIGPGEYKPSWIPLHAFLEIPDQVALIMKPEVEEYNEKLAALYPNELATDFREFIKRIIIIQKQEDSEKQAKTQVGIGGDIVLTTMGLTENNNFIISSEIIYEFPDKEEVGEYMMELLQES